MTNATTYPHYFKPTPFAAIDVYRVLALWEVNHPALAHAAKKVLCAGQRGTKAWRKDIEEARDSLQRALDMDAEDLAALRVGDDGKSSLQISIGPQGISISGKLAEDEAALRAGNAGKDAALPKLDTAALDAWSSAMADAATKGTGWMQMGVDFGPAGDVHFTTAHHPAAGLQPAAVGVGTAEHRAAQAEANERAAKAIGALTGGVCACGGPICNHKIGPACGTLDANGLGQWGRYLAALSANTKLPMATFIERVLESIEHGAKVDCHYDKDLTAIDGFVLSREQRQAFDIETTRRRLNAGAAAAAKGLA